VFYTDTPVLAMSASGMPAMKEQSPHLHNGRPLRREDIADVEIRRKPTAGGGRTGDHGGAA